MKHMALMNEMQRLFYYSNLYFCTYIVNRIAKLINLNAILL